MNDNRKYWLQRFVKDLILFGKKISPNTFDKPTPPFHYDLAKVIMDTTKKKICIEAPRGFAKSTIVACFFVLHHLFFDTRMPIKYIVLQSKTLKEAKKRLRTIKNIFEYGEFFIAMFGYWGKETARMWTEDKIILKDGSTIEAIGTGQPVRGLKEGDVRPTLLILDDPEDEENTKTDDAMDNNFDKLLAALPGLQTPYGRVIVIGTPINNNSTIRSL